MHKAFDIFVTSLGLLFAVFSIQAVEQNMSISAERLLADVKYLSSDMVAGRKPSTKGHELAQNYILQAFMAANLQALTGNYRQTFSFKRGTGNNLLGAIKGNRYAEQYWVITAHYDHLGQRGSKIYNGANDNASGVAALMELARYFAVNSPEYSMIFLATDAEEDGLYGAEYFVNNAPVPISSVILNINLDMIGHGGRKKRLYLAGTRRHDELKKAVQPFVKNLSSMSFTLKLGHDGMSRSRITSSQRNNWKQASDHAAFIKKGIAYLYFGAEMNSTYHTTKDTFDRLDPKFYISAVNAILQISVELQSLTPQQLKNES